MTSKVNGKTEISTRCRPETPENIETKIHLEVLMLMLQLEMYQPLPNEQQRQQQQQSTTVVQPTVAAQPVFYVVPSTPAVCELYASVQSQIAGIILIIAGAFSVIFNIVGMSLQEWWTFYGHGYACGVMVRLFYGRCMLFVTAVLRVI